jgi:hypothetical protein
MSLRILTFILVIVLTSFFGGCSSKRIHQMEIKGVVYDSENQKPISGAKIEIEVSNPRQKMELSTDKEGLYAFNDSGVDVLMDEFLSEEDLELSTRKVVIKINHSDFIEDVFEEEVKVIPVDPVTVDVGAFYLLPKDKDPLFVIESLEN